MRLHRAVLLGVAALAGCASVPDAGRYDVEALGQSLARTLCDDASPHVETVPNEHVDNVVDRIERRSCVLGSSTMYVSTQASDPSGLALHLEILQAGSGVPRFLELGQPAAGAIRRLGIPSNREGHRTTFVSGGYDDEFTIEHPGGVIRSLTWTWSVD